MSTVIPPDHFQKVCKPGQGVDCCRYIVAGADGIECAKHIPELQRQIDARVHGMIAKSDNCDGIRPETQSSGSRH